MKLKFCVPLVALFAVTCSGGDNQKPSNPPGPTATPVQVSQVRLQTLPELVAAPGSTDTMREETIRAPFPGTVTAVRVNDGDHVRAGQVVASIVARDSLAELTGAEEMLRRASTPDQRTDAERAVDLARQNLVEKTLQSSVDGVVKSHSAVAGDRVGEGDDLLSIASLRNVAFVADVTQAQVAKIQPGNPVSIQLTGRDAAVAGAVWTLLPGDPSNMTTPVRIRFTSDAAPLGIGLVGTAEIVVAEHRHVPTVPDEAILRDDVSGTTRIAIADGGKLHWQEVQTGLSYRNAVEIVFPVLSEGTEVITSGQVGLAEGAPVKVPGS